MTTTQGSEAVHRVVVEKDLPMRTRDGVTLYADVYRPDAADRFPVLVVRTPYDKSQDMALTEKDYFPSRGYVVVVQDTRGRFRSEGEFYPFIYEAQDGYDRNPNTGHDFGVDAELRTARQTIFHDNCYPSHLILPVIPR